MNDQELHESLSTKYFNEVWSFIDLNKRTPEQNILMREMAHASLYHWLKRHDLTPTNISVGLWQVSRVHSLLLEHHIALHYAKECVEISGELDVFYLVYAHEAAARAYLGLRDEEHRLKHYEKAIRLLPKIKDESNLSFLKADLGELEPSS